MSFDINWDKIYTDDRIRDDLQNFLNEKLSEIPLPTYLNDLKIVKFSLGDKSPQLTIKDINYPFPEFYADTNLPIFTTQEQQPAPAYAHVVPRHLSSTNPYSIIPGHSAKPPTLPTTWEASRSPSPITFSGTPFGNNNSGGHSQRPSTPALNSPPGILNSPMASRTKILGGGASRSNSAHFLTSGGVGLGGFGLMESQHGEVERHRENTEIATEYHSVPMNTNLSIDGELDYNDDSINTSINAITKGISGMNIDQTTEQQEQQNDNEKKSAEPPKTNFDLQLSVDLKWDSNMYVEVVCNLLVNYPAPEFIKLPVRLKITNLFIHSLAIVAYLDKKVYISFLCDIEDNEQSEDGNANSGGTSGGSNPARSDFTNGSGSLDGRQDSRKSSITELHHIPALNRERIDIIKNLKIEGELGNCDYLSDEAVSHHLETSNGSILRNIGKIEKFLVTALRSLLIRELGWPSWIELDFGDDEDDYDSDPDTPEPE